MFRRGTAALLAIGLTGCVNNLAANRISSESYPNDVARTSFSRVFAWDARYSAGIGNSRGLCAQGALTAEAGSVGAALDATAKKIDTSAKAALQGAKAVTALNVSNAQTAFANIGYFYVCQLALNSLSSDTPMTSEQILRLFLSISETAPKIRSGEGQIAAAKAEQLQAFKDILQKNGLTLPPTVADELDKLGAE